MIFPNKLKEGYLTGGVHIGMVRSEQGDLRMGFHLVEPESSSLSHKGVVGVEVFREKNDFSWVLSGSGAKELRSST